MRFNVHLENETVAIARFADHGFVPDRIERDGSEIAVLVFLQPADPAEMHRLVMAAPRELSAIQAVIGGMQRQPR